MSETIGEFIKTKVYPVIDAVERGLLDHLSPKAMSSQGYYTLDCPACKQDRAFYYPGRAGVQCNRKDNCPSPYTSLWDALSDNNLTGREIVEALCKAANVAPPDNREQNQRHTSSPDAPARTKTSVGQAIIQVTQALAKQNPQILESFRIARGYTAEVMSKLRLGVYTTNEEVLRMLRVLGVTNEDARAKGIIKYEDDRPDEIWSGMEGRVIGYWPHLDGDVRIWGRIPVGPGEGKKHPKYRFSSLSSKEIPYLFRSRQKSILVCVEGTLDAWALQLVGIWGTAIGQASINKAQALYLASQGVTEAAHMVDGDQAGWDGAVSSIREAEAVGITLSIIALGKGMDDADFLRTNGRESELTRLVESRLNAGEYLACLCAAAMDQPLPDLRAVAKLRHAAKGLGPISARKWEDHSRSLGIHSDGEADAFGMLGHLLSGGLSVTEGIALVKKKLGYQIAITKDTING